MSDTRQFFITRLKVNGSFPLSPTNIDITCTNTTVYYIIFPPCFFFISPAVCSINYIHTYAPFQPCYLHCVCCKYSHNCKYVYLFFIQQRLRNKIKSTNEAWYFDSTAKVFISQCRSKLNLKMIHYFVMGPSVCLDLQKIKWRGRFLPK